MTLQIRGGDPLHFRGDTLLLFHPSDVKPLDGTVALLDWRCNAAISVLRKRKPTLFRFGQLTVMATQGKIPCPTVILTGLGPGKRFSEDLRLEAYRIALEAALKLEGRKIAVEGIPMDGRYDEGVLQSLSRAVESLGMESRAVSLFSGDREFVLSLRNAGDAGALAGPA